MKKTLMLACLLFVLPLMVASTANATTWYYLTEDAADHDSDDTLKIIGKPAGKLEFSTGDCDGTNYPEDLYQGYSYVVVSGATDKSSRIGEAWFTDDALNKGSNLSDVVEGATGCTQEVEGATKTFKKFSAQE